MALLNLIGDTPADFGFPSRFTTFRTVQKEAARFVGEGPSPDLPTRRFVACGLPTGCHANPDEELISGKGHYKRVIDFEPGDTVMGPSGPRTVLELCSGQDHLFTITPTKGDPFVVNGEHMLSLVKTQEGSNYPCERGGRTIDISVRAYLRTSNTFKHLHKLFRVGVSEFQADGNPRDLPMSPYLLGLLLGDGTFTQSQVAITKGEPELLQPITEAIHQFGLTPKPLSRNGICTGWRLSNRNGLSNPLLDALSALRLRGRSAGEKFIPPIYRTSGKEVRLQLLAGLLDTDGHYSGGGYDYISKSPLLADGVCFLARSLGLAAYLKRCEKYCQTGTGGIYYRVIISGDCSTVPCRITRKKAQTRGQKKDVLRTGFTIERYGYGEYWGFRLDGDGRYLLGDFTVTHNSGKELLAQWVGKLSGGRFITLTATKSLQDQCQKAGYTGLVDIRGRANYVCTDRDMPDGTDCEEGDRSGCRYAGTSRCTYTRQSQIASVAPSVLSNYQYWCNARGRNGGALEREGELRVLICDEVHRVLDELARCLGTWVSNTDLHRYAGPSIRQVVNQTGGAEWGRLSGEWVDALDTAYMSTLARMESIAVGYSSEAEAHRRSDEYRKLEKLSSNLEKVVTHGGDGNWLWRHTRAGIAFDCVWPARYAERYLWSGVPKVVLMSATLRPKTLQLLGLRPDQYWFREWGRVFPAANSPVYWVPTGRMGHKAPEDEKLKQIVTGQQLWDEWGVRGRMKGIVHTNSYRLAEWLQSNAPYGRHMIVSRPGEAMAAATRYRESMEPVMLVSPSFAEGHDFQDENCGWQWVPKLPFADRSDPVVLTRSETDPEWYNHDAMQKLVQACGRKTRRDDQRCITIITDDAVRGFRNYAREGAPKWWRCLDAPNGKVPPVPESWKNAVVG